MARYPIIDNQTGRVVNVIEWYGKTPWTAPKNTTIGEPSATVNPGDQWDGAQFVPGPSDPPPEKTADEEIADLKARLAALEAKAGL